ncbi:MAG TPA: hemerythrin domain-containing protein [bacterium]|nr:hemerythrin domain-containing protein [bacterium]
MRSTQDLVEEHRIIEGVLGALTLRLDEAERTRSVPIGFLRNLITFSQSFVDRCHHAKEERCLFPCLEKRGIPNDGGPIGVMLQEHQMGRGLVRQIAERLDQYERGAAEIGAVVEPCRQYVDLLQQHILKENTVLFPMGHRVLADHDDEQTRRCYEDEEHEMGGGEHARLIGLAEAMSAEA